PHRSRLVTGFCHGSIETRLPTRRSLAGRGASRDAVLTKHREGRDAISDPSNTVPADQQVRICRHRDESWRPAMPVVKSLRPQSLYPLQVEAARRSSDVSFLAREARDSAALLARLKVLEWPVSDQAA